MFDLLISNLLQSATRLHTAWITALLILVASLPRVARSEASIVDVRRNIQLSDEEPVYKDFYISSAREAGLKANQVVKVMRRMPMRDATGVQSFGELNVEVGRLRIIFVQDNMAVGREYELFSRDNLPMLEQIGIMIGDRLDTDGSFVDNKTKSAKRSKSEAEPRLAEAPKPAE
jgi:hypothetical protein